MFEQKLVFQVDISSFLHFGAKRTKKKQRKITYFWKNLIFFTL